MKLLPAQLSEYKEKGVFVLEECFHIRDIKKFKAEIVKLIEGKNPGIAYESDNITIRALHGCQIFSKLFNRVIKDERLLLPAMQLLVGEIYLHQLKVNIKSAFHGEIWPWHQDFIYWHKKDYILHPNLINIVIPLDDICEFNSPLYFIPGSHREGMIENKITISAEVEGYNENLWAKDVSADLTYQVDKQTVKRLVNTYGIISPKISAGSVLFFNPNVVHASLPNISPYSRNLIIITYNKTDNKPYKKGSRPAFICNTDYRALESPNAIDTFSDPSE